MTFRERKAERLRRASAQRSRERAARERPRLAVFRCGPGTPRLYRCSACGTVGQWGDGWSWYGTIEGPPERFACPAC